MIPCAFATGRHTGNRCGPPPAPLAARSMPSWRISSGATALLRLAWDADYGERPPPTIGFTTFTPSSTGTATSAG